MHYSDFQQFFRVYLDANYGKNTKWTIQRTKKGAMYNTHSYRMFISNKEDRPLAQSIELMGYRVNSWTAEQYATFITTLKSVENDVG